MTPHECLELGELYHGSVVALRELRLVEERLRKARLDDGRLLVLARVAQEASFRLERALAAGTVSALRS
jgi:hypothetical protein